MMNAFKDAFMVKTLDDLMKVKPIKNKIYRVLESEDILLYSKNVGWVSILTDKIVLREVELETEGEND